jgi:hypothetical protein
VDGLGADAPRSPSTTGWPPGGDVVCQARFDRNLRQGCRNGSKCVFARDPEGELESRL